MTASSFVHSWIWPAGGSGGIPGDIVGGLEQLVLIGIVATLFWPRLRRALEQLFHRFMSSHPVHGEIAEIKRMAAHIIEHHPDIPNLPLLERDEKGPQSMSSLIASAPRPPEELPSTFHQWWEDVLHWLEGLIGDGTPTTTPGPGPTPPTPTPTSGMVAWTVEDASIAATDAEAWVAALNAQVADLQALWPHVQEWSHVLVSAAAPAPAGSIPATIRKTQPGDPSGALGWHDVDANGTPLIVILSDTCAQAGIPVSSCMSHEACELTVDPTCVLTATAPNGDVWALEVADPVESSSYNAPNGVQLSDFVGPDFFGEGPGTLDKTGDATAAFTISAGGYAIINGNAVFGESFPDVRRRNVEALGQKGTPRRPL